jgi:chromatin remodeling complex protein RSC6
MTKTAKTPAKKTSSAPKKGASKRPASKASTAVSAVAPPAAPAPVVVATPESSDNAVVPSAAGGALESSVPGLQMEFTNYLAKIQQAVSLLSTLRQDFRQLERRAVRELKAAEKVSNRRKRRAGNRAPSGFVKPTKISDELASFLGKDSGTEMARTEVTREINAYIRQNDLQDKSNGRQINADDKLSVLLSLKKEDTLTYFNLQRFMSRHFAKAGQPLINSAPSS